MQEKLGSSRHRVCLLRHYCALAKLHPRSGRVIEEVSEEREEEEFDAVLTSKFWYRILSTNVFALTIFGG